MENKFISASKLQGEVIPPPSKSILHRYIIGASLAKGISRIENVAYSDDIKATIIAMKELGAKITEEENSLLIDGTSTFLNLEKNKKIIIDCNESGSTLRFLIPISLINGNEVIFKGKGKLLKRPLEPYFFNFKEKEITYEYKSENTISFKGNLKNGVYKIAGNISSQFVTGLLFSLPLLKKDSKILIEGNLESKSYVDMTLDCLKDFGVKIENKNYEEFLIKGGQEYKKISHSVEADYSQAAFFIIANSIGANIKIKNLNLNSLQGDKKIIQLISTIDEWNRDERLIIDGRDTPDIIPILTLKAIASKKEIKIINIGRLRIKESDRLRAIVTEFSKLGYDLIEKEESIIINSKIGNNLENIDKEIIEVSSHSDHRIAMMLAITTFYYRKKIKLDNLDCVKKSYPNFWEVFLSLGGKVE